jgi:hypothetical protein
MCCWSLVPGLAEQLFSSFVFNFHDEEVETFRPVNISSGTDHTIIRQRSVATTTGLKPTIAADPS